MSNELSRQLTRRRFLQAAGFIGATSITIVSGAASADAAVAGLSGEQTAITMKVAKAGAVFPVPFPGFGEKGSAIARATPARLLAAQRRCRADQLRLAEAGADQLISLKLAAVSQPQLLDQLGSLAGSTNSVTRARLDALLALAISTVANHFDPNSTAAARIWLDGLHRLHQRGELLRLAQNRAGR